MGNKNLTGRNNVKFAIVAKAVKDSQEQFEGYLDGAMHGLSVGVAESRYSADAELAAIMANAPKSQDKENQVPTGRNSALSPEQKSWFKGFLTKVVADNDKPADTSAEAPSASSPTPY